MQPATINMRLHTQKGFVTSDLTTTVTWTILLVFSLVLSLLFAATIINDIKERSIKGSLKDYADTILLQVDHNFKSINTKVNNSINNNLALLNSTDNNNFINAIKQDLPSALRVMVSTQVLNDIKPMNFPAINYATLDMLKNTRKTNQDPIAEIHLFGQQNQYLNYIHTLNNKQESYLIISLPAAEILTGLSNPNIAEGRIVVTQKAGEFSRINLKSWGTVPTSSDLITSTSAVPNSFFHVEYAYVAPFYLLRGMTTMSALVGLLSSVLLFVAVILSIMKKIKLIKQKQIDTSVYVPTGKPRELKYIEGTTQQNKKITDNNMTKKIKIDKSIFRAYDIRGIVDEALTVDTVKLIGQAIGTENKKRGNNDIVVARDGRLSGNTLLKALIQGLNQSGCNVINIGAVPTGVLYFATHHLGIGSGVMLTGSHNPPNYNGLKIMLNGETLAGKLIMNLYRSIINKELDEGEGSEQSMDIVDDYVDYISSDIQLENELKVVVDAGNGIGGIVGPQVLEEIGCEVIQLHCEVDGNFPNHHPDPSVPENLRDLIASVKATDADLGIAFDGDADRLGVVTKEGEVIFSDRVLMLFAKDVLTRQPGASIIFDVKCTGHLPKVIVQSGGLPIIWKTGHSFMKAKLQETKAALAGEMSGHFFFNERWFGFDDGIYAAARLLEILDQEDRPATEVFAELPNSVSTPELKCHTQEGENYAFMEKFQKVASFPNANLTTIDGIRADFADGWGLVRCSNTTPCLVLRFDADNQEALDRIKQEFRQQILAVDDTLKLPF
ncbi:Phosphoglucomutase @ Phosphomannomutase [hydrothermal vent metagenome]|uniref:Phosphoglucomutase @ Phosphomannomutase n=1 Tax=hydrothermal vent metagenome TaxID=652676 RepID=A0A3B0URX2_9ZZZZ